MRTIWNWQIIIDSSELLQKDVWSLIIPLLLYLHLKKRTLESLIAIHKLLYRPTHVLYCIAYRLYVCILMLMQYLCMYVLDLHVHAYNAIYAYNMHE